MKAHVSSITDLDKIDTAPCNNFAQHKCFWIVLLRSRDTVLVYDKEHAHPHVEGAEHF